MKNGDRIVGNVAKNIADYWEIPEQSGKIILQGEDWLLKHGAKHKKEFKCIYNFNQAIENIPNIIKNPNYVFYNEKEKSLEYYKKLKEDVSLVVRVTGKKHLFIATIYPASSDKVGNRKNKEIFLIDFETYRKYVKNSDWLLKIAYMGKCIIPISCSF